MPMSLPGTSCGAPRRAVPHGPHDLERVVRAYAAGLPGRVLAAYLTGSQHERTAVPRSDINVVLIVHPLTAIERDTSAALVQAVIAGSQRPLDLQVYELDALPSTEMARLKLASSFLSGTDIRPTLELPSLHDYQRAVTWTAYRFLGPIVRGADVLCYPLAYPAPDEPFYGYDGVRRPIRPGARGERGTRGLVHSVTRMASAWLAVQCGQHSSGQLAAVSHFTEQIGGGWADYVDAVVRLCKGAWHYHLPEQPAAAERLAELCRMTLEFENAYLAVYRSYLLACLAGTDDAQGFAAERLGQVVFADGEIAAALRALARHASADVRQAAADALKRAASSARGAEGDG